VRAPLVAWFATGVPVSDVGGCYGGYHRESVPIRNRSESCENRMHVAGQQGATQVRWPVPATLAGDAGRAGRASVPRVSPEQSVRERRRLGHHYRKHW
jgi:hypothetical protein